MPNARTRAIRGFWRSVPLFPMFPSFLGSCVLVVGVFNPVRTLPDLESWRGVIGLPRSGAAELHHVASRQLVQVVGIPRHHFPALGEVLRLVVDAGHPFLDVR